MFDNSTLATGATAYDVAVIGAGPAGAATALQLARAGCRVLLIERSTFDAPRVGESLAPSVQPLLVELGVWDRFLALGPLPCWGTRSVWGAAEPQVHSHLMSPYGCGWHVDRLRFDRLLAEAAVAAGATLLAGVRLGDCVEQRDGAWRLTVCGGERISQATVRVVVDAAGRGARVSQTLGAKRLVCDRLVGVAVLFGGVPNDSQGYTLVETSADGWWYSAPVGSDRMVVMLMTDGDLGGRGGLMCRANWQVRLQAAHATAARLGDAPAVWGPRVFSAVSQRLHRNDTASRWLAVGDAALAVDPASGSGVVRALRTARAGAEAALELLQRNSCAALESYEADRDREFAHYLRERAMYYGLEQRWHESPFWQRRRLPTQV